MVPKNSLVISENSTRKHLPLSKARGRRSNIRPDKIDRAINVKWLYKCTDKKTSQFSNWNTEFFLFVFSTLNPEIVDYER